MEISKNGSIDINKRTVFLDVDDVILRSAETVINILNKRHGTNKTFQDMKDWVFRSINRQYQMKDIEDIFESDEFWNQVQICDLCLKGLESCFDLYNWVLVTKGSRINLTKKLKYLLNVPFFIKNWSKISYYGLGPEEDKSIIRMLGRIQVDDNYSNLLKTDADLKILLKNNIDTQYNTCRHSTDNLENLYIVDNIAQVFEVLTFMGQSELLGEDLLEGMTTELEQDFL